MQAYPNTFDIYLKEGARLFYEGWISIDFNF
jgi:hypothetical protein